MKNILKTVIAVLMLTVVLSCFVNVFAFDGDTYSIDIPETFQKNEGTDFDMWVNIQTGNTVQVFSAPNTNSENYLFADEETVAYMLPQMETAIESQVLSYGSDANIEVKDISGEIININGLNVLAWTIESNINIGIDDTRVFQKVYTFATVNYIHTLTITSHTPLELSIEENDIVNSFTVNDEFFTEDMLNTGFLQNKLLLTVLIVVALIVIVIIVVVIIIIVKKCGK